MVLVHLFTKALLLLFYYFCVSIGLFCPNNLFSKLCLFFSVFLLFSTLFIVLLFEEDK